MDNAKSQLADKLKSSTNILVTVSRNPSVDQLSACVGLTLLLNKLDKHATAVFSGEVPSTLEFLKPEQTLEKNTDSLRDFIIALDKSKADKLRYKVEDDMVRIFITPYRVSISDKDLEFSQGDFNVDVVIALGVSRQEDFDEAITAHGRILHDAVIGSVSVHGGVELGGMNWSDNTASSLSEMVVSLSGLLGENLLDRQVATALLTGIVSETERFSNEKTTPQTMTVSSQLMAAGANQQLVASQLQVSEAAKPTQPDQAVESKDPEPEIKPAADGTLQIAHEDTLDSIIEDLDSEPAELPTPVMPSAMDYEETAVRDDGNPSDSRASRLIVEPPTLGGTLTANTIPEQLEPANDILGVSAQPPQPLLDRTPAPTAAPLPSPQPKVEQPTAGFTPPPQSWVPSDLSQSTPTTAKTLSEIEEAVHSGDLTLLDDARGEVARALTSQPMPPQPVQALGAQPLGDPLHPIGDQPAVPANPGFSDVLNQVIPPASPASAPPTMPVPPVNTGPSPTVNDPTAPPPVPPPIPFNFNPPQPPTQQ